MLGVATSYPNPPRCTDTTKRPPGISNSTYKRVRAYMCKMRWNLLSNKSLEIPKERPTQRCPK